MKTIWNHLCELHELLSFVLCCPLPASKNKAMSQCDCNVLLQSFLKITVILKSPKCLNYCHSHHLTLQPGVCAHDDRNRRYQRNQSTFLSRSFTSSSKLPSSAILFLSLGSVVQAWSSTSLAKGTGWTSFGWQCWPRYTPSSASSQELLPQRNASSWNSRQALWRRPQKKHLMTWQL